MPERERDSIFEWDPERANWDRRRFLKAAGLLVAGASALPLLDACGGATDQAASSTTVPKPRKGASIRLLQWVSFVKAADAEFVRQATEFGDKYGVTVSIERITADQLQAKTAAAVEAKAGPDIIQMQYAWPHLYTSQCDDVSNEVNILKSKIGQPLAVNDAFCKVDGKYRAIPYTVVPNAWTYRTDNFKTAGITTFPKTWDDFAAAAAKIKSAGLPPIAQTDGHAYGDSLSMWNPVLWSFGGREANSDGKTIAIDSKETRAAIKWAQDAVKGGFVVHPEWLDPDNNQAYHANRTSGTLNGASIYIREKVEFKKYDQVTDNAAVPGGPKGIFTMNLIFNHAVMKYSPERETAKALLLYLMDKDTYLKWTDAAGGYNAGPYDTFKNDPVFNKDPKMKAFIDVVPTGKWPGWPATPSKATAQAQTQYIVADMFAQAIDGSKTTDQAVKEAADKLNAIFSRPT